MAVSFSTEVMSIKGGGDLVLKDLLRDVHYWQHRAVAEWMATPSRVDGCQNVLLNWYGDPISMPLYSSFKKVWETSGFTNPFEFPWFITDKPDLGYLNFVIDALNEQVLLWSSTEDVAASIAFGHFLTFTDRIERLYQYLLFSAAKGRFFI